MSKIVLVLAKTIKWQCSGCDHLCAMLTDETISPDEIIKCPGAKDKWRKEEK